MKAFASFAEYFTYLCQSRKMGRKQLAVAAGVSSWTIYNWKRGDTLPRVDELNAVLAALGADGAECVQAFALVETPRTAQARLDGTAYAGKPKPEAEDDDTDEAPDDDSSVPGSGALWRAMCERKGLTAQQLSDIVGVDRYEVSRWHSSKVLPPEDMLPTLFDVLEAHPEERRFLTSRSRTLEPLEFEASWDEKGLNQAAEHLARLERASAKSKEIPGDLAFLALEAFLRELLRAGFGDAERLLARSSVAHADWLDRHGRYERLHNYTGTALRMRNGPLPENEHWWARATTLHAHALTLGPASSRPRNAISQPMVAIPAQYPSAVAFLRSQLEVFSHLSHISELRRNLATFLYPQGGENTGEAIFIAKQTWDIALRQAEEDGDALELVKSSVTLSRILRETGHPEDALRHIGRHLEIQPLSDATTTDASLATWLVLTQAEALADLGAWREARDALATFRRFCTDFRLSHLDWLGNRVQGRLDAGGDGP